MNCDQIREVLEVYALGALDPAEQALVARHLEGCPACSRLAAEYAETLGALPLALAAAAPRRLPDEVKTRLLRAVAAPPAHVGDMTNGEARAEATRVSGVVTDGPPAPALTPIDAAPARPEVAAAQTGGRRPRWLHPRVLSTVSAVLLLALALGWALRLNAALAKERALNAGFAQLVGQQETVLEIVDSPKTVKVLLRPPAGTSSPAYGKLYTRPDLPQVVVMAARLTPPSPGQSYHLWLTRQGETSLAGVMAVNDQGFGLLVFDADRNGPTYDAARLTLQADGATAPATPPILVWER